MDLPCIILVISINDLSVGNLYHCTSGFYTKKNPWEFQDIIISRNVFLYRTSLHILISTKEVKKVSMEFQIRDTIQSSQSKHTILPLDIRLLIWDLILQQARIVYIDIRSHTNRTPPITTFQSSCTSPPRPVPSH